MTKEQKQTERLLVKKYANKVYTKQGDYNFRTINAIGMAANLEEPKPWKSYPDGNPIIDHYYMESGGWGGAKEIKYIYGFCLRIYNKQVELNK